MKRMTIENFKSYKNSTEVNFSSLTLNVGMNSVGKSTVTQCLLLLRQLFEYSQNTNQNKITLHLNGFCDLELGQFNEIVSDQNRPIKICTDDREYFFYADENAYNVECDTSENCMDVFFSKGFYYINAERLGPRNYHKLTDDSDELCGIHGEYTFEAIARNSLLLVDDAKLFREKKSLAKTLPIQVEAWMTYVVSGIMFYPNESKDNRIASMRMRQTTMDMDLASPYNFGFGISYLLSIIVTCLIATKGSTIVIENPEAHLHPAGQSHMGQFLAQMIEAGLNVVVETHSEHLINGIRLFCLKNSISPENICINYFSLEESGTKVQRINLSEDMNIVDWPEGFFDQEEIDMLEMRKIRRNNANISNME